MSAKRKGSEYWIVTRFIFHEHDSAEAANTEADRLRGLFPDKKFRVIRCKRNLRQNSSLHAAAADLLEALEVMVQEADRNQRPGGGSTVPAIARAAIAKAKGDAA